MAVSPLRIALLGKTGSGKSSLANTILREDVFTVDHSANACPDGFHAETRNINGTDFTVMDTVGLFDRQRSEDEMRNEMARCLVECAPGPHAYLILLKKENYTNQEEDVIQKILTTFTDEALNYAIIVFTHGDDLQRNETIEDFVETNADLRRLYNKCGRRCYVVDNKYWENNQDHPYRNNQVQVEQLLNEVKRMAETNRRHYTNAVLEELARRTETADGTMKEKAKEMLVKFLKRAAGMTTGILLGALVGLPVAVASVIRVLISMPGETLAKFSEGAIPISAAIAIGAVVAGGSYGAYRGFQEAENADSISKAASNTASALFNEAKEITNSFICASKPHQS